MKELVVSCVRVALKDPNKLVDEQTKDFWKWRDTILYSEDVLLEALCFDLDVESPYKTMYDMMKYYGVEHNKKLRNSAWAFLSDSTSTQMCLLFTSRTIAAASLYAGARMADAELGDDDDMVGDPTRAVTRHSAGVQFDGGSVRKISRQGRRAVNVRWT
jgi:protein BUR2